MRLLMLPLPLLLLLFLQDAESGTIEMKLEWQNCFVDQYMD